MNQKSNSQKPANNGRLAWAVIITLIAGLIIGGVIGKNSKRKWPCCNGDMTAKVCLPKSQKNGYRILQPDTNCLHHCYVQNDPDHVREVERADARKYARLFGHWIGQHTGRVEYYNTEQIQRGRSGLADTLPTSIIPTVAWKIDLRELCIDMGGPEQVRAYLVTKDLGPKYYSTPELELIFAKVGPQGRDDTTAGYFNIVHPCPNTCGANSNDELFNAVQTGVQAGRTSVVSGHRLHTCPDF